MGASESADEIQYANHNTWCPLRLGIICIAQKFNSTPMVAMHSINISAVCNGLNVTQLQAVMIISTLPQSHTCFKSNSTCQLYEPTIVFKPRDCIKLVDSLSSLDTTYSSLDDPVVSMQYMPGIIPEHNGCWAVYCRRTSISQSFKLENQII